MITVSFRIGARWWVLPYLRLMDHLEHQCGVRIDYGKVLRRALRGVYLEMNGKRVPLYP